MSTKRETRITRHQAPTVGSYRGLLTDVVGIVEASRRTMVRSVNHIMTATYWILGRRLVLHDQGGRPRAGYGERLLKRLSCDLCARFGRGFSERNLELMRRFYLTWPISQTASAKSVGQPRFALPWSHYVRLLALPSPESRAYYETEARRGGWTVAQLERQIDSQFYERTLLSRKTPRMAAKHRSSRSSEVIDPAEEIKNPLVLEFLGLKDEYSENDLEEALIARLEAFLLELGGEFAFIGRQKRLRVGDQWYRIDLLLFHRRLRCLVVIDLKLGAFTPADAGQMHLYLNYARTHWTLPKENPPVGLILCAHRDSAVARYALEGLSNRVMASEYRTALPKERFLAAELTRSRKLLEPSVSRRTLPASRAGHIQGAVQSDGGGG